MNYINVETPILLIFTLFFCYKCFVLNNEKDNLEKFDDKSNESIFVGYSLTSKAYKFFNKINLTIEESNHVSFDETSLSKKDKVVHINEYDVDDALKDINNSDEHYK